MKKFITLLFASVLALTVSARDTYVGGRVGFWHESTSSYSANTLSVMPEFGFNINSKWSAGAIFGYEMTAICGVASTNLFEFSPYARYTYFRSSNNLVSLFVDGGAGLGLGWTKLKAMSDTDCAVVWNLGVKPGIALNFTDRLSFVAHIGFLGYQGANHAARMGGHKSQGGLLLDGNNITFGLYLTF